MTNNIEKIIKEHREYQEVLAKLGIALVEGLVKGEVDIVDGKVFAPDFSNTDYDGFCGEGKEGYNPECCKDCICNSCLGDCEDCEDCDDVEEPVKSKQAEVKTQKPISAEDVLKILIQDINNTHEANAFPIGPHKSI